MIGEISHYTGLPKYSNNGRKGWELAVAEINAAGGVLGRPLKVISRDDNARPQDSVRCAQELVLRDHAQFLMGVPLDLCAMGVSSWARQNRVLFIKTLGGTDRFVGRERHRYAFRIGPTNSLICAMLVQEAAKLPARRWAAVAPNYEYGHAMTETFRTQLTRLRPDIEWVAQQFPALNQIDAGPVVQALKAARPQALFCVLFQTDLVQFCREATKRELLPDLPVVSTQAGRPEELDILGSETPAGWITWGYPSDQIATPEHRSFVQKYRARYQEYPGVMSIDGYLAVQFLARAIAKAGALDTEKVIDALEGLTIASPLGLVTMRAWDHQTDRGFWVGTTAVRNGRGALVNYVFKPSHLYLPTDSLVRRPLK